MNEGDIIVMNELITKIIHKAYKVIKNPRLFIYKLKLSRFLPEKTDISWRYFNIFNKKIDFKNPKTFNEKLQWLKLYNHNPQYTQLVDKFEVREYIKKEIGEKYLIPIYGVWEKFEDIDFNSLPNQFVLKCTHDSGSVVICKDKETLNIRDIKSEFNKALKKNFYYSSREWPYKNIKPRIICEELLVDELQGELIDYKIMCFNGEPRCLFLCLERRSDDGLKVDFYDLDWNPLPFERHYPRSNQTIQKPTCLDEMLELSKTLSKGIPFVRVDFYIVNDQIKFGELTFFPGSGMEEFTPESYDCLLGSWLDLSKVKSPKSTPKSL